MADFLLTSLVIFAVLSGWLYVQELYRGFARRHPELGPFRREEGCGGCSCRQGGCTVEPPAPLAPPIVDLNAADALRVNHRRKQE